MVKRKVNQKREIKDGDQSPDQHIIDPNQPWDKSTKSTITGKNPATGSDDIEAITDEIFNEKVSELNDSNMTNARDNVYAQVPQVNLEKFSYIK